MITFEEMIVAISKQVSSKVHSGDENFWKAYEPEVRERLIKNEIDLAFHDAVRKQLDREAGLLTE